MSRHRNAFTSIELLVVLMVALVLIGMAVPALVSARHHGSVSDAANAVVRVSSQARQYARTRQPSAAGDYYGLTLACENGQAYAALTYGPDATPARIQMQPGTAKPVSKLLFNRNVVVYAGRAYDPAAATPLREGSAVGWLYQYRTGYPIATPSPAAKPVNLGVDPEWPVPAGPDVPRGQFPDALRHISLRTADGRYRTAIAIYQIGLTNVQDF